MKSFDSIEILAVIDAPQKNRINSVQIKLLKDLYIKTIYYAQLLEETKQMNIYKEVGQDNECTFA